MFGKKKKKTKTKRLLGFLKFQIFLMALVLGALAYYYFGGYAEKVQAMKNEAVSLVAASSTSTFKETQTSIAYDCNGEVLSVLKGEKDVYYIEYDDIPVYIIQAIVCTEDRRFYKHNGIDYKSVARAVVAMVQNGEVTQGASTITQQLARTVFLSNDRTWERKVEEMYIAVELEAKYTKEQILEFYLNNVYFGNGYYGIEAAAEGYFGTDVSHLSLSQQVFLTAIINNPTTYNPRTNLENTLTRRDRILKTMLDEKIISETSYNTAIAEEITVLDAESVKNDYAETYTLYCATRALMEVEGFEFQTTFSSDEEEEAYNTAYSELYAECNAKLFTGGYRIYTSLDLTMQEQLQKAVDDVLSDFTSLSDDGVYEMQGSAVCIDNSTGMVRAIVGGRSQELEGYTLNRAYQSFRQPGSSIKPLLVYTPALELGYTADSIVLDEEIEDGPSNSYGYYMGEITIRTAVAYSSNIIAWKLLDELTPATALTYLQNMGFAKITENDEVMAISIGGFTYGMSALEMAKGYATLANDGGYRNPSCIIKIVDTQGNIIYEADQTAAQIYKVNAARQMTDILQSVMSYGTGKEYALEDMPCAGKTGTTNNNKDGWFVGYTAYYTTSVWVGYDIPQVVEGLKGSSYPAQIWYQFMSDIHQGLSAVDFVAPITTPEIEKTTVAIINDGSADEEEESESATEENSDETADDAVDDTDTLADETLEDEADTDAGDVATDVDEEATAEDAED